MQSGPWSAVREMLSHKPETVGMRRGKRGMGTGDSKAVWALGNDDFLFLQPYFVSEMCVTPSNISMIRGRNEMVKAG